MAATTIDESRLEAFMGQAVVDLAAAFTAPLVRLGARRGSTCSGRRRPGDAHELAKRTGVRCHWRYGSLGAGFDWIDALGRPPNKPPETSARIANGRSGRAVKPP